MSKASMAMGFYLHHSLLWCIHQFRISYFSAANLKKLSDYQKSQQACPTCKVSDRFFPKLWKIGAIQNQYPIVVYYGVMSDSESKNVRPM